MSSLRTFVDPGASPQQPTFLKTGLLNNLAFSNFYSSAEESDLENAIHTARQHNEQPSQEAPISGLNHLEEYITNKL